MRSILTKPKNIYLALVYRILLLLIIYTISRYLFYLFNKDLFSIENSHLLTLLISGIRFDVSAIMYINSLYILLQVIPFKFRANITYQKALKYLFIISNGIMLLFNSIDFAYFRFANKRTTLSVFKEFSNDISNYSLLSKLVVDYWWAFAIWLIILIAIIKLYGSVKVTKWNVNNKKYYTTSSILMILILGIVVIGFRNLGDVPLSVSQASNKANTAKETGIVLNTPFSLIRTVSTKIDKYYTYTESELNKITNPIHKDEHKKQFTPKNVVILILEGFGKAHTKLMPFVDSLSREGLSFKYSYANGTLSNDALPSILLSIPALASTYTTTIYANNEVDGLAKELKKKGYNASFYHGASKGTLRFSQFVNMIGYQYCGREAFNNEQEYDGFWGIWDEPFLQYMAESINNNDKPSLSVVFTLTSHHPFKIPEKYKNKFPEGELPIYKTISYSDYAISKFFETAKQMSWYNNTLFVLTADHTSITNNQGYKSDAGAFSVPIIFYDPGNPELKHYETEKMMQQIDIYPSILDYLNYDNDYFAFGESIFSQDSTHFLINLTNGVYQVFKDKYLLQINNTQPLGLYNLQTDSLLKHNVITKEKKRAENMEVMFKGFRQQYNNRLILNKTTIK